jgi:HlyD family secretion protein
MNSKPASQTSSEAAPASGKHPASQPVATPVSRVPTAKGGSRIGLPLMSVGGLGLIALLVVFFAWKGLFFGIRKYTGPTWKVVKEPLKVTIVARGTLESAKNSDISCTVRSGQKGSTIATTIKWLTDEGTSVKKGDKIMELDSSGFTETLKDKNKDVDNAYAAKIKADQDVLIQESQNETDIEAAKNALVLADINLEKYKDGDYQQQVKQLEGQIKTAESDLEDWKDRSAWSARMVKKGLMSKVTADADASHREASQITLDNYKEQLRVLNQYTKKASEQDLKAKLEEARRSLDRVKLQAVAKLEQAKANRKTCQSVYDLELARKQDIENEIAKCTILAPQDGLVVYYIPEQAGRGAGTQQSIVAQGEPVREGQKMMQIPDLSHMIVTARVPEAFVAHLHGSAPHDHTNRQEATIRVDSFSKSGLHGYVQTVDTMASAADFFASDVKVYKTRIAIKDSLPGLKPGMSAEVTIFAEESPEPVKVVPVQAVLGTIAMGVHRKVFVVDANSQAVEREIEVGMSNERVVEVRSGLEEGDLVALAPQTLIKDDSELKPGKPRTVGGHGGDFGGPGGPAGPGGEGGKDGGKKGGKGGPGGPGGPKGGKGPGGPPQGMPMMP